MFLLIITLILLHSFIFSIPLHQCIIRTCSQVYEVLQLSSVESLFKFHVPFTVVSKVTTPCPCRFLSSYVSESGPSHFPLCSRYSLSWSVNLVPPAITSTELRFREFQTWGSLHSCGQILPIRHIVRGYGITDADDIRQTRRGPPLTKNSVKRVRGAIVLNECTQYHTLHWPISIAGQILN